MDNFRNPLILLGLRDPQKLSTLSTLLYIRVIFLAIFLPPKKSYQHTINKLSTSYPHCSILWITLFYPMFFYPQNELYIKVTVQPTPFPKANLLQFTPAIHSQRRLCRFPVATQLTLLIKWRSAYQLK